MDLHRFRVEQRSFSPSPANSTNPDNTISAISGSQTSNSPTGPTFHFQPNPLIPQRGVLQSIPWGQEPSSVQSSIASPLQSPAHLLPGQYEMQMPVYGAVGGGRVSYVKPARRVTPYRGFAYTPTRPSTGRLSRLTIGDSDRHCGFGCWFLFLFSCCAIVGLGGMWLFQVLIFAHKDFRVPMST